MSTISRILKKEIRRLSHLYPPTSFMQGGLLLLLLSAYLPTYGKAAPPIKLMQSAQQVWQRQQVLVTLEIKTDDPFSRLEVDDFKQQGFEIIAFEQQRIENPTEGQTENHAKNNNQVLLRQQWAIFPFVAGDHQLTLPQVTYRPNGGRKQKLPKHSLSLKVQRLPIYVPPTMPVGRIELKANWGESLWVSTHQLLQSEITVHGLGVVQQTMPPLSRQLISNPSLNILPVQTSHQSLRDTTTGITSQTQYKIPFKALNSGRLSLPPVAVQFFDPITGKLQKAPLATPFIIALSPWLSWLMGLLLLALLGLTSIFIVKKLRPIWQQSRQTKHALAALSGAQDYPQAQAALLQLCNVKSSAHCHSLGEFSQRWQQQHGPSPKLDKAITALQAHQFSTKHSGKSAELKKIIGDLRHSLDK